MIVSFLRYIWTDPLCWFSIDRSIIITKCTRKRIYKQHLLCNTPLLNVADTSQIHGTIKYFEWLWSPADNGSEEVRIMYWHTTSHWIDWVDIQGLVCDNPFQESTSVALKYFTKDHIPPWRCSDVITDHLSFLLSFDEAVNTENTNQFRLKIKRTIIYLSAKLLIYQT